MPTALEICEAHHAATAIAQGAVDNLITLLGQEEAARLDAEHAAAKAGAEAGALRIEVRRLCERIEQLEAEAAGRAA